MIVRHLTTVVCVCVVGCTSAPPAKKLWVDQYKGLRNIPEPTMARNMLTNICESAAYDGDASAVLMMLRDLRDEPLRHDELAARCAAHLYGRDAESAKRIVAAIGDPNLQAATKDKLFGKKEIPAGVADDKSKDEADADKLHRTTGRG